MSQTDSVTCWSNTEEDDRVEHCLPEGRGSEVNNYFENT